MKPVLAALLVLSAPPRRRHGSGNRHSSSDSALCWHDGSRSPFFRHQAWRSALRSPLPPSSMSSPPSGTPTKPMTLMTTSKMKRTISIPTSQTATRPSRNPTSQRSQEMTTALVEAARNSRTVAKIQPSSSRKTRYSQVPIESGEMPTRQSPRVGKGAVGKRNRSWETRTST